MLQMLGPTGAYLHWAPPRDGFPCFQTPEKTHRLSICQDAVRAFSSHLTISYREMAQASCSAVK